MRRQFVLLFLLISSFTFQTIFAQDSSRVSIIGSLYDNWTHMGPMAIHNENKLFVINNTDEIHIFSMTCPWDPSLYKKFKVAENPCALEIEDNYLYLGTYSRSFEIYNIRWYSDIQLVSRIENFGTITSMVANDPYLYAIRANNGLKVLDVSIKEEPRLITSVNLPGSLHYTTLYQDYLYVGSNIDSLYVINVADTNNVFISNTIGYNSYIMDTKRCGERLYVGVADEGIYIYDLQQPAYPTLLGHYEDIDVPNDIEIIADTLYVSGGEDDLIILDAIDPENILQIGLFDRNIIDSYVFDDYIIGNYFGFCMVSLSIADFDSIYQCYIYGNSYIQDIEYYEDHLLCADSNDGLHSSFVFAPERPEHYKTMKLPHPTCVAVHDTFMAVISDFSDLILTSTNQFWNDPPEIFSTHDTGIFAKKVEIDENYIYVASEVNGFEIFDYSNPYEVTRLNSYTSPVSGFAIHDDLAIVARSSNGIAILGISDPSTEIIEMSEMAFSGQVYDVFYYQNCVFVSNGEAGFSIVDINDPYNPVLINTIDTDGEVRDVNIYGFAYIADGENGIRVYDPSNPNDFIEIGYYDTPGSVIDVEPWHDVCGFSDSDQFMIAKHENATDIKTGFNPLIPSAFKINSIYPNPFNPSTNILIDIPVDGSLEVAVFNILGQKVTSLLDSPVEPGRHNIAFKGTFLASGTYIVKATFNNEEVSTQRIQLMK